MKFRVSFVSGFIGAILGMLGSLIWMELGAGLWANALSEAAGIESSSDIPPSYLSIGFIISGFQSFVTYVFYIVALAKSLPKSIEANPRKNGLWLLWIGIGTGIFNVFLLLPCILLIVAGTIALKRKVESGMNV